MRTVPKAQAAARLGGHWSAYPGWTPGRSLVWLDARRARKFKAPLSFRRTLRARLQARETGSPLPAGRVAGCGLAALRRDPVSRA